ncbi:MAG: hypothetical protein RLZZ41_522 [Actinomycetota bacterium]
MKILFTGKNHSQGLKDLDPSSLSGAARSLGHVLAISGDEDPDLVVCVDFHKSALPAVRKAKSKKIPTVLVANEPEVVIPEHSQIRILNEFDKVLKVGRPNSPEALKWPQTWLPIASNKERQDRVVLVNADKWSFVRGQHYWLRAASSSQFTSVDVFGFGWERTAWVRLAHRIFELWRTMASRTWPNFQGVTKILATPLNYMGSVSDKNSAMADYKVALVVENSSEFLTEKLFDAWFAGCIPVYVGPPVEAFGIPRSLVIQVTEPTVQGVRDGIDLAMAADREVFLANLREYLSSGVEVEWKAEFALKAILESSTQRLRPNS